MTWTSLGKTYGITRGGAKHRQTLVNAAIRGEMVGGDDLLDALELVHRLRTRLDERDLAGIDEAAAAETSLVALRDLMQRLVLARHGIS